MSQPKVALFVTCLVDQLFPEVGEAAVRLLERAGCEVDVPLAQTCCGQPAWNSGYRDEAARLARRTVEVLEPYASVVVPSGSCASMLRVSYPELFHDEPAWQKRAERLAEKVFELTEYLAAQGFDASGSRFRGKVAYHASCHLLRELGIRRAPLELLAQVPGVELVEMADAETCCGFGGVFSAKMADLSGAMLDDKLEAATASGADVLTATDCGCLMHLGGALHRRRARLGAVHVAEILATDDDG